MQKELEDIDEKLYFCPYCRTISFGEELFYTKEKIGFRCLNCKQKFYKDSYDERSLRKGGKAYKFIDNLHPYESVENEIVESITNLYWDGHTQREIQKITRFSQEIIRKAMKYIYQEAPEEKKYLTKKQFLRKKLGVSEKDWTTYKNREYNAPVDTLKNLEQTIINAYNFGCTYENIENLLHISSKTVSTVINKNPQHIYLICHHKIIIEPNKITIIDKTRRRKKRKIPTNL